MKRRTAPEGTAQPTAQEPNGRYGQRAWNREVARLNDAEVMRVVRSMVEVDRAVADYRKGRAA